MTDEATAHRTNLVPVPRPRIANPWQNGLGVTGFLLLLVGGIVFLIPPTATAQLDGSSIVNFPAMYEQYGLALAAIILGTGLVAAWALVGAQEWRLQHS